MGCDIHLYVEKRDGSGWVSCDTWEKDEYEPHRLTVPYGKHFYSSRNYDTFAILADVRNGSGFAGCPTGDGFVPISEAKGLPGDLSPELAAEVEASLEHTPSWLTVRELMDYDWTQTTTKTGIVNGPEYDRWESFQKRRGDGPDSWRGDIMGGAVKHVSEEYMLAQVKQIRERYKDRQQQRTIHCRYPTASRQRNSAGRLRT
jgi:hypothetical protein